MKPKGNKAASGKPPATASPPPGELPTKGKDTENAPENKKRKKAASEIDDIFNMGVNAAKDVAQPVDMPDELKEIAAKIKQARDVKKAYAGQAAPTEAAKRPKVEGSVDDLFGSGAGTRRKRTEEGFPIYSEEELGLTRKNAGNTDLCPFDCDCCF